ncbi:MAG: DMT family transporter [Gemmatimonadetes bacterium]|nr:DMT family transporter [Gemmatimonadota bacterium]
MTTGAPAAPGALPRARSPLAATALVAVAACCFGSISTLTLVGLGTGVALPALITWRYLIAAPLLFLLAGPAAFRQERGVTVRLLVLGGGGQAIVTAFTLLALRWVPAATEAFLFYTFPAWVAIIAAVRGTERLTRDRVIALVLSLAGIAVMVGAPGAAALDPIGVSFVLGAAIVYALYIPLIDGLRRRTNASIASAWLSTGATIAFATWAVVDGSLLAPMPARAWGVAVTLAVLSTVIAFSLLLRGLATLGPVRTAIVATVEPFWTVVLAASLLGQPVTIQTVSGGVLIAGAVLLLQRQPEMDAEDAAAGV